MKKVLLTNYNIVNYTGSELDTITIADYFLKKGYDVTIFTINCGNPLYNEIDKKIKIISYNNLNQLEEKYDIIWAHHFPLLDYLLFKKKIKADYIHFISLSSFLGYEALPVYYKKLNLVSVLSEEGLMKLKEEKIDIKKIKIFPNYSFKEYFDIPLKKRVKPKKICIVSNHVAPELLDFKDIAEENNIVVDIYGMGYKYEKITSELLNQYDAVITIAKTVYFSLSLGIPCYCYDHFGGDGLITKENVEKSFKYNFSGRYSKKKKTGKEIYKEITENYKEVISQVGQLRKFAYNTFCFENIMKKALKELNATEKFDLDSVLKEFPALERSAPLFVEEHGNLLKVSNKYYNYSEYCQVFLDTGKGFNENESEIKFYRKEKKKKTFELKLTKNVQRIRLDFSDRAFVHIKKLSINKKRIHLDNKVVNCIKYQGGYLSINDDPMIILERKDFKDNKLNISMELEKEDQEKLIIDLFDINKKLKEEISYFRKYKLYRLINKIRKKR